MNLIKLNPLLVNTMMFITNNLLTNKKSAQVLRDMTLVLRLT